MSLDKAALSTEFKTALKSILASSNASNNILIAYSGGLDSHVLLHLLSQISELNIRAIHFHHGLQAVADCWVPHCQNICKELGIPLEVVYLNLEPAKGESIEAIAHHQRYKALSSSLQKNEVLLTAQHQNDQSETLLLQLFRGAGVQGLASMPVVYNFAKGVHARPLLNIARQQLEAYAKYHKLNHIEDPSNQDVAFDRNYLRNKILPKLRERWLGLDKALNRSARIQAETKQILDEIAAQDILKIGLEDNTLLISKLKTLSYPRQKLLLRYWILQSCFKYPSEKKLEHVFSDVIQAREDAQPLIEWEGVQIRRYKDKLYIMKPLSEHNMSQILIWDTRYSLSIPSLKLILNPEVLYELNQKVTVRFRQGGEEVQGFLNSSKKYSLKKCLTKADIPPWQRSRLPLIYKENKLIQVIGLNFKWYE